MSNSPTRRINYTPRVSPWDAYDQLGPRVRKALQEAMISWDAAWCLRMVRKHGADFVIKAIRDGDEKHCLKGFIPGRGKRKPVPGTFPSVPILRANW